MKDVLKRFRQYNSVLLKMVSSSKFSWVIITLFVVQALWVTWTFSWIIFDERFHFGIIDTYTQHWWPVIYDQPHSYDIYRDFAGEGSKLYHFLMSFPLRGLEFFTSDQIMQLRLLRIVNVIMGVVGLWGFFKLFDLVKVRRVYSNIAMTVFIMLPIVPWVGGSVNYDNFIFMLTPFFLYGVVSTMRSKEISFISIMWLVAVGLLASLAKFTFLPVFALGAVVVAYGMWKKARTKRLKISFPKKLSKKIIAGGLIVGVVVLGILFSQTYLYNFVKYGTPRPVCQETLGVSRCLQNSVIQRNEKLLQDKAGQPREGIILYSYEWLSYTHKTLFYSSSPNANPLPVIMVSFTVLFLVGLIYLIAILVMNSRVLVNLFIPLLLTALYVAIVFVEHYKLYQLYGIPLAVQGRYLLIILPIVITAMVIATHHVLVARFSKNRRTVIMAGLSALFLIGVLQGGGATTHLVRMESGSYWEGTSRSVNLKVRNIARKAVIENY